MRIVVLADTHLRDGAPRDLPRAVWAAVDTCDLVLHAGDVTGQELLDRLSDRAPLVAVLGNNDHSLGRVLPERWSDVLGGVRISMIHDSGARAGRGSRMARRYPGSEVVVFGHSHDPVNAVESGVRLFNPGSPTQRRRAPHPTFGELVIEDGQLVSATIRHADTGDALSL